MFSTLVTKPMTATEVIADGSRIAVSDFIDGLRRADAAEFGRMTADPLMPVSVRACHTAAVADAIADERDVSRPPWTARYKMDETVLSPSIRPVFAGWRTGYAARRRT